jgi:hypothetical protein
MNEINERMHIWREWYGEKLDVLMSLGEMEILIGEGWLADDIELELAERMIMEYGQ